MNIKKTATYDVGNLSPCLGQTQKCGRLKPVIWISNDNTGINKQSKTTLIHFHSKRPHTIIRMNDNINMDSITASRMLIVNPNPCMMKE